MKQTSPPRTIVAYPCLYLSVSPRTRSPPQDTYRVLSASDRNYINEIARQSGDLLTMTTYGVQAYKLRFHEGTHAFCLLSAPTGVVS
jgi:hypothetical protein